MPRELRLMEIRQWRWWCHQRPDSYFELPRQLSHNIPKKMRMSFDVRWWSVVLHSHWYLLEDISSPDAFVYNYDWETFCNRMPEPADQLDRRLFRTNRCNCRFHNMTAKPMERTTVTRTTRLIVIDLPLFEDDQHEKPLVDWDIASWHCSNSFWRSLHTKRRKWKECLQQGLFSFFINEPFVVSLTRSSPRESPQWKWEKPRWSTASWSSRVHHRIFTTPVMKLTR